MESNKQKKKGLELINIGELQRETIYDYIFNCNEVKFVYHSINFKIAAYYIPIIKETIFKESCLHQDTKDFIEICYAEINKIAEQCKDKTINSFDHYIYIQEIHKFHEITMRYLAFIRYLKNELLMINIVFYDMYGTKDLKLLELFKRLIEDLKNISVQTLMDLSMDDISETNKALMILETAKV